MCHLFFSFRNGPIRSLLQEFLDKCTNNSTYTPNVNHRHCTTIKDGFGIAWKQNGRWKIYKQPKTYREDPNIETILHNIQSDLVIAHIRRKKYGNSSMENTHPFYYNGQIFAQNGNIGNFEEHKELLRNYMYAPFVNKIEGQTDTEYLFFLFLSCMKYIDSTNSNSKVSEFSRVQQGMYKKLIHDSKIQQPTEPSTKYINAFILLIQIFKRHSIELGANIIYSDNTVVLVSRYIFYDENNYKKTQISPALYWNKSKKQENESILITSEPLKNYDNILFSENSVVVFDVKKYTVHMQSNI